MCRKECLRFYNQLQSSYKGLLSRYFSDGGLRPKAKAWYATLVNDYFLSFVLSFSSWCKTRSRGLPITKQGRGSDLASSGFKEGEPLIMAVETGKKDVKTGKRQNREGLKQSLSRWPSRNLT